MSVCDVTIKGNSTIDRITNIYIQITLACLQVRANVEVQNNVYASLNGLLHISLPHTALNT